jgi:hypothetical protein
MHTFRPVSLAGSPRGGLTHDGGVLTNTSYPHRTSPVLRGGWLLERILGERVPPPPPDVPALEETGSAGGSVAARAAGAASRAAECATCHDRIDPLGFGLEHFDAIGRWRTEDGGCRSTPRANCRRARSFDGPEELKQILLARSDQFVKHLIRQMLGFALGSALNRFDQCVIDDTFRALQREGLPRRTADRGDRGQLSVPASVYQEVSNLVHPFSPHVHGPVNRREAMSRTPPTFLRFRGARFSAGPESPSGCPGSTRWPASTCSPARPNSPPRRWPACSSPTAFGRTIGSRNRRARFFTCRSRSNRWPISVRICCLPGSTRRTAAKGTGTMPRRPIS